MATNPSTLAENVGRITAASGDYPFGSAKDDTTGTAGDGTPIKKALLNDTYGFFQALLSAAGATPTGSADRVGASQYRDAVLLLAVAASLNKPIEEVLLDSNTTASLDGVKYVHAVAPQVTWSVPTLNGSGETINSVTGDQLETTGGTYTLLATGVTEWKEQLAPTHDPAFDYNIGMKTYFSGLYYNRIVGTGATADPSSSADWVVYDPDFSAKIADNAADIAAIFGAQSLAENGYLSLGSGVIFQWGRADGGTITFPIAFPNACFTVVGTPGTSSANVGEPYKIGSITPTNFFQIMKTLGETSDCKWTAIGH